MVRHLLLAREIMRRHPVHPWAVPVASREGQARVRIGARDLPAALVLLVLGCGAPNAHANTTDGGSPWDGTADSATPSGDAPGGSDRAIPPGDAVVGTDGADAGCPAMGDGSPDGIVSTGVPIHHRPSGTACPQQRAALTPVAACECPADAGIRAPIVSPDGSVCVCGSCYKDSDCTIGSNGRCGELGPLAYLGCTYDGCFNDSDCAGAAPCECRPSSASSAANVCQSGSNCSTDADCGPGGYCSPSVVNNFCACPSTALCADSGVMCYAGSTAVPCVCGDSCGHGYFCHTACDTCVDDGDCGSGGTCNYNVLSHRWECATCWPVL